MENYNTARGMLLIAPVPQQTKSYKPVSHEQLMDLTLESIYQAGFTLDQELYTSARDGKVANGKFTIKNVADTEMQLQIGWQNSYDKSLSLKFAIGTKIFICANGCVSGDYGAFKKKHVGEIQTFTPQAITEYIKHAGDAFTKMQGEREIMKTIELDRRTQAELIGRMIIEEKFIESTQLNIIRGELDKPTHDYGSANSLWELYQFTTYSMKQVHPSLWMNNHINAHSFFTEASGIITSKQEIILSVVNQLELFELL